MATYVTLINWTDQGIRAAKDSPKRLDAFKQMLKNAGGELRGVYLTLGAYDLVAVLDAPSDEVAAKLVLSVASQAMCVRRRSRRSRRMNTGRSLAPSRRKSVHITGVGPRSALVMYLARDLTGPIGARGR